MAIIYCTNTTLTLRPLLVQRSTQSSERAALRFLWSHDGGAGPSGRGRSFSGATLRPQTDRRSLQNLRGEDQCVRDRNTVDTERRGGEITPKHILPPLIHKANIATLLTTFINPPKQLMQHWPQRRSDWFYQLWVTVHVCLVACWQTACKSLEAQKKKNCRRAHTVMSFKYLDYFCQLIS